MPRLTVLASAAKAVSCLRLSPDEGFRPTSGWQFVQAARPEASAFSKISVWTLANVGWRFGDGPARSESFSSQAVADYNKKDDAFKKANPAPRATVTDVANHIDHIKKIAGIDHIGLGGDFDGIEDVVQGLEDTSKYPHLIVELLKRGYTDAEIKKITNENIIRALRGAEATAKSLRK